jgi:hypothetical protein
MGLVIGFGLAIVLAAGATWVVAQETIKGQTFAAAIAAGLLGTFGGRLISSRASIGVFVAAIAVLAAVSPAAATFYHSSDPALVRASLAGSLFPPARLMPLDWIAGAFVGIPMGLNLAASMGEVQVSDG